MDTNETIEPVGGADVTASQDTSDDVTQPVEATQEVNNDDQGKAEAVEASEELLAGKYKNQDELVKAHQELEKKLGEQGQKAELANLIEKQTGMTTQQIRENLDRQQQQQLDQQIQDNPGLAALQEVQELKSQVALQAEEKELDSFLRSEEGKPYAEQRDKILKLGLNLEKDKTFGEIAKEYFGESRAKGQQDAYNKIETKKNTQATGASQAAPKGKVSLEDLAGMSTEDMEAVLPHADISNRL